MDFVGIVLVVLIIVAAAVVGLIWVFKKPKLNGGNTRAAQLSSSSSSSPTINDARLVARGELPPAERAQLTQLSTGELAQRAGQALLEADDAINTAEEEIGFAMAAYGTEPVKEFQQHLERAQESVLQAFRINQQLEDDPQLPEEQKRTKYLEIIGHEQYVSQQLEAQEKWFDQLRGLESQAEEGAQKLADEQLELEAKIVQAQKVSERLEQSYRGASLAEVSSNLKHLLEGQQRLATKLSKAQQALANSDKSTATLALREGWETASQMRNLAEAITHKEQNLLVTQDNLRAGITESEQDLAEVEQILASGRFSSLRAPATALRQTLDEIYPALKQPKTDPETLLDRLAKAHAALDAQLSQARDYTQQRARAEAALEQALTTAGAKIQGAQDFITSRRGSVQYAARAKLLEAQEQLKKSRQTRSADPVGALNAAHQAAQLADQASRIAQADMEDSSDQIYWGRPGGPRPGGGGYYRRRF